MDKIDIEEIRNEFIKESINSPTLISDLANMEKYISESYDGRALIELLQNADDALSTRFYIEKLDENTFLVANNGRAFTREDLVSLCRSGASTKKRKSTTIGFRGIGFKSVVNFSQEVHLISGNIKLTFSKEKTKKAINKDINVPLIRIPHIFNENKYNEIINKTLKLGYNTIFIFETNKSTLKAEIDEFDNTCMLFLKHINQVKFNYDSNSINTIARTKIEDHLMASINNNNNIERWLVINNENDIESIAFKYENNSVMPTNDKNYIHSFMPTKDRFSIPCKINGDFSTDPSRTRIIIDDDSIMAIDNIAKNMSKLLIKIIIQQEDRYRILSVVSKIKTNMLINILKKSINDYFFEKLKEHFLDALKKYYDHNKIYIQPIWLSNEDLDLLGITNDYVINRELLEKINGLEQLLRLLDVNLIDMNSILKSTINKEFSNYTRLNILKYIIDKYEFNLPNEQKEFISKGLLFKGINNITSLENIKNIKDIDEDYLNELINLVGNEKKVELFFKKFNILVTENKSKDKTENKIIISKDIHTFTQKSVIQKWRSVEQNVKLILEEFDDITEVIDVSKRNIGYDLEAICKNGERRFYEVKSVNNLGDQFSMTNNEVLTASQHPSQYYLCIVKQDDRKIEMCLINNPANTLNLERRVRAWEYICESYDGIKIERLLDG